MVPPSRCSDYYEGHPPIREPPSSRGPSVASRMSVPGLSPHYSDLPELRSQINRSCIPYYGCPDLRSLISYQYIIYTILLHARISDPDQISDFRSHISDPRSHISDIRYQIPDPRFPCIPYYCSLCACQTLYFTCSLP